MTDKEILIDGSNHFYKYLIRECNLHPEEEAKKRREHVNAFFERTEDMQEAVEVNNSFSIYNSVLEFEAKYEAARKSGKLEVIDLYLSKVIEGGDNAKSQR